MTNTYSKTMVRVVLWLLMMRTQRPGGCLVKVFPIRGHFQVTTFSIKSADTHAQDNCTRSFSDVRVDVSSVKTTTWRIAQSIGRSAARLSEHIVQICVVGIEKVVCLPDRFFLNSIVTKLKFRSPQTPTKVIINAWVVEWVVGRHIATRTQWSFPFSIDKVHMKFTPSVNRMFGHF